MHLHVCHQLLPLQEAAVALVALVHNAVQGQVAPQCLGVGHLGPADLTDVRQFWVDALNVVPAGSRLHEEQPTMLALVLVALRLHVLHKGGKQAEPAVAHPAAVVARLRPVVLLLHPHVFVGVLGAQEVVLEVVVVVEDHVAHGAKAVRLLVVTQRVALEGPWAGEGLAAGRHNALEPLLQPVQVVHVQVVQGVALDHRVAHVAVVPHLGGKAELQQLGVRWHVRRVQVPGLACAGAVLGGSRFRGGGFSLFRGNRGGCDVGFLCPLLRGNGCVLRSSSGGLSFRARGLRDAVHCSLLGQLGLAAVRDRHAEQTALHVLVGEVRQAALHPAHVHVVLVHLARLWAGKAHAAQEAGARRRGVHGVLLAARLQAPRGLRGLRRSSHCTGPTPLLRRRLLLLPHGHVNPIRHVLLRRTTTGP
uniref:Putative secreted protein n=1 Tax=Ixodes ricinus TaxID=34613 RepID=A0A6B0VAR5_IXORI